MPIPPPPSARSRNSSSTAISSRCAVTTQFSPTTHSTETRTGASSSPAAATSVTYRCFPSSVTDARSGESRRRRASSSPSSSASTTAVSSSSDGSRSASQRSWSSSSRSHADSQSSARSDCCASNRKAVSTPSVSPAGRVSMRRSRYLPSRRLVLRPLERRSDHRNSSRTASASGSDAVSPGDSIPKRFTRPGTPWARGPCTTKSAAGASLPQILGRMPA